MIVCLIAYTFVCIKVSTSCTTLWLKWYGINNNFIKVQKVVANDYRLTVLCHLACDTAHVLVVLVNSFDLSFLLTCM